MQQNDYVKACPFCGERMGVVDRDSGAFRMACDNCGALGPTSTSRSNAVGCWNSRAPEAMAALKAIREECDRGLNCSVVNIRRIASAAINELEDRPVPDAARETKENL